MSIECTGPSTYPEAKCVCLCGACRNSNCFACSVNIFHAYCCRIECHGDGHA